MGRKNYLNQGVGAAPGNNLRNFSIRLDIAASKLPTYSPTPAAPLEAVAPHRMRRWSLAARCKLGPLNRDVVNGRAQAPQTPPGLRPALIKHSQHRGEDLEGTRAIQQVLGRVHASGLTYTLMPYCSRRRKYPVRRSKTSGRFRRRRSLNFAPTATFTGDNKPRGHGKGQVQTVARSILTTFHVVVTFPKPWRRGASRDGSTADTAAHDRGCCRTCRRLEEFGCSSSGGCREHQRR